MCVEAELFCNDLYYLTKSNNISTANTVMFICDTGTGAAPWGGGGKGAKAPLKDFKKGEN